MYKNILVATDGSQRSRAAALAAVKMAKALGAKVTGFYAAPAPTPVIYKNLLPVGFTQPKDHARMIEQTATKYLQVIQKAAKAARVRCKVIHVTDEYPDEAILKVAAKEKCDLIVMSSHSRTGVARLFLGSQTQKVLSNSKVPVLIHR